MMKPPLEIKVPGEEKDYGIDWAPEIADSEITIQSSLWTIVTPLGSPDLTVATHDIDGQQTIVRLSGGQEEFDYTIENAIVLSNGETLHDAIEVRVRSVAKKAGIH